MRAADYWDQAMDVPTYVGQMTMNRETFARRIDETAIDEATRAAFAERSLRVLVLTEDFCGDSAQFIPPVAKLAQELATIEVRILLRNEARELADQYRRKDGYQAIPVFIVLDAGGGEIGYLIERPQRVYDALASETRRFAQDNPHLDGITRTYDRMPDETRHAVRANADRYRDGEQAAWTRWLFEDLAALVARPMAAAD